MAGTAQVRRDEEPYAEEIRALLLRAQQGDVVASHVLKTCLPPTVRLLCERLARRVGRLPAALRRLGKAVVPVIIEELGRPGSRDERVVLAGVAAEIGARLPARDRVELMEELVIVQRLCGDEAVSGAVGEAIRGLRRVDQQPLAGEQVRQPGIGLPRQRWKR